MELAEISLQNLMYYQFDHTVLLHEKTFVSVSWLSKYIPSSEQLDIDPTEFGEDCIGNQLRYEKTR